MNQLKEEWEKETSLIINKSRVNINERIGVGPHFEVYEGIAFSSLPVIVKKSMHKFSNHKVEDIEKYLIPRM